MNHGSIKMKKVAGSKRKKEPWPTKKVMEQIYQMKLWGGNSANFYSGEGSHLPDLVNPYIDVLTSFLRSFDSPLTVCDLGCGDFNVGKELVKYSKQYVAVDIVPELIVRNKETFKDDNLEFHCLDIAKDELPAGDVAIVRQVLQHLSNAEIQSILLKLTNFKYAIVTEHVPEGIFVPNKDIISGQGIRIKKQSGVDLLAPPFNFEVQDVKELLLLKLNDGIGVVVTTLYHIF
ncbi:class I SAM-dependent methyltransferase [Sediminicola sp. 1XM1-17]|uniref:class I SAM-dependent methyltransferase n=1 Tax=Sediminicola sp. 1XM1-17 TaxID=3127702 RepID=UPI003077375D